MTQDSLQHEYGVLLGVSGPKLMDRAEKFRQMAELLGSGPAATWLNAQAERAEQSIIAIGRKFDECHR